MYYPGLGNDWDRKSPEEVNMDSERLNEAIAYTLNHETSLSRDLYQSIAQERLEDPNDDGIVLGPTRPREGVNGIILRHGYIIAEWGDTKRVDMTFSATKSYLSTVAGLALDKKLIEDVNDRICDYVHDGGFDSPHNSKITWHYLLQQTSEWVGSLWSKHWRAGERIHMRERSIEEPGTFWSYNDTRVNRLALSLLQVWRKPLPQVLKEEIMDPIGASCTWRWYGYRNSWVDINGLKMQSVSGGGHWGGGMWINSLDHARFGYLFLRLGKWKDKQLISERWIDSMTRPTIQNPLYGYMWWLNTACKGLPSAPEISYSALGWGGNRVFIDPEHELVIVIRWLESNCFDNFVKQVIEAIY